VNGDCPVDSLLEIPERMIRSTCGTSGSTYASPAGRSPGGSRGRCWRRLAGLAGVEVSRVNQVGAFAAGDTLAPAHLSRSTVWQGPFGGQLAGPTVRRW